MAYRPPGPLSARPRESCPNSSQYTLLRITTSQTEEIMPF